MSLYDDSEYPVDEALQAIHEAQLDTLGGPGTWLTRSQRVALVEEVRAARIEAGVQETVGAPAPVSDGADLSDTAKHVAREAALSPGTFVREFYEDAVRDGLTDAEYVEIVGIVGRLVNFTSLPVVWVSGPDLSACREEIIRLDGDRPRRSPREPGSIPCLQDRVAVMPPGKCTATLRWCLSSFGG